jgi:hypothetical protein
MPTVARLARELDGGRAVDAGGGTIDSLPANGLQAHRGWGRPRPAGQKEIVRSTVSGIGQRNECV